MICPQCRGEFRPEISRCPDCDVKLVARDDTVSAEARPSTGASHLVLRTADPAELALAQGLLESAGIPFAVNNERMTGLFPSALAGPTLDAKFRAAEIEVLESDLPGARQALSDLDGVVTDDVHGT